MMDDLATLLVRDAFRIHMKAWTTLGETRTTCHNFTTP